MLDGDFCTCAARFLLIRRKECKDTESSGEEESENAGDSLVLCGLFHCVSRILARRPKLHKERRLE